MNIRLRARGRSNSDLPRRGTNGVIRVRSNEEQQFIISSHLLFEFGFMSNTQLARSCGVILVHGDPVKSFLLMRHFDRWDFPKGHVDPGETDLECALREMEEETGISRSHVRVDPDFIYEQQYQVAGTRYGGSETEMVTKTLVLYLAYADQEYEISPTEHDDSRWFPWNPPHSIQPRAIDPLLTALEDYLIRKESNAPESHRGTA